MLTRAFKEHQSRQTAAKDVQEVRKKEAIAAVTDFSQRFVEVLNSDVESAYNNQRQLEAEAKQLQNNVSRLTKQTQQWISMIDNFNHTLKELGDVENWARAIETDMIAIASALEYAYKGDGPT
ncbi:biogenesis of lysosome-related organelles complex 1 subunit 1-like [Rhopilema esculentum]|uniref:biogenesis of lysosome-related organelles complex 1 subunit 1-like n=1 Tax=Rhopilema esculentum TaxID=499914 RepID=UPI0031D9E061